jgi:sugar/nucleoside kinase (ribokinase family)
VSATAPETLLLGALSLDVYLGRDLVLAGGGVLNMAWHWRRAGEPFHLLSRVGDDRPEVFGRFLERHAIPHSAETLVTHGPSASIDIVIRPDLQPHMDNFVEGVWSAYRSTPTEESLVAGARRLHVVLVEGAIRELDRLAAGGQTAHLEVTADFLGFRHYTVERFAETMRTVDVGFIGWPGPLDDPAVAGLRDAAHRLGRLVVVTLGSRGVQVFDGRAGEEDRFVPVVPVPVTGTTVGCGDAFIAAFLASWRGSRDVVAAVERGKGAGAEATAWRRPLPDAAYGPEAAASLLAADQAAADQPVASPGATGQVRRAVSAG